MFCIQAGKFTICDPASTVASLQMQSAMPGTDFIIPVTLPAYVHSPYRNGLSELRQFYNRYNRIGYKDIHTITDLNFIPLALRYIY